jgi:hypothetical protein
MIRIIERQRGGIHAAQGARRKYDQAMQKKRRKEAEKV